MASLNDGFPSIKNRFVQQLLVVLLTDSPTWAVFLCSSSRVTKNLLAASLINTLLTETVSLLGSHILATHRLQQSCKNY